MKDTVIREDDWRAELERVLWASDEGLTIKELCKVMKLSTQNVRLRLQLLNEGGKLIVGKRHVRAIDGVMRACPVYQLKKAKRS